jgi:hypothetical protein
LLGQPVPDLGEVASRLSASLITYNSVPPNHNFLPQTHLIPHPRLPPPCNFLSGRCLSPPPPTPRFRHIPSHLISHPGARRPNLEPRLTRYHWPTQNEHSKHPNSTARRISPPTPFPVYPTLSFTLMGQSRAANRSTASYNSASRPVICEKRFHSIRSGVGRLLATQSP